MITDRPTHGGLRPSGGPAWLACVVALVVSCSPNAPQSESPSASFVDVAGSSGVSAETVSGGNQEEHLLGTTGTGVAVADYDNDGDLDLYLATAQTVEDWVARRRPHANKLYRNDGDATFSEVAPQAGVDLHGWSNGVYFVDYDNDDDKDLFVTAWGPNVLYENNGDGTFADVTERAGLSGAPDGWSTSAAFADLDSDGDLDVYVANYVEYDLSSPPTTQIWQGIEVMRGPRGLVGQADYLYRNNGDGTFTDISAAAGLLEFSGLAYGLGVVTVDFDDDGDPDIYVANDSTANWLWRNDGNLQFTEVGMLSGLAANEDAKEQAGMGTDAADYNGDLRPDLVVTNFSHDWNTLYRNDGNLIAVDATFESGITDTYLSLGWGTKFFDYDNDGLLDLFFANGHVYGAVDEHPKLNTRYKQANALYRNLGDGTFDDLSSVAGSGLEIVECSRGLAVADLNGDGGLDLVVTNMGAAPNVLMNRTEGRGNWIGFLLKGTQSNRDAIGAKLTLEAGGRTQVREVNPFGSYQSQSAYAVHFGLGEASRIERVWVRWPSGTTVEVEGLDAGNTYTLVEGEGIAE